MIKEKKKILVVEDNSETQLIIKVNLREHFDVHIRDNAVEAISLISNNNFDLVLLDINLRGEFDGKEVLNAFAYTGAFAVYAARVAGAQVVSVWPRRESLEDLFLREVRR